MEQATKTAEWWPMVGGVKTLSLIACFLLPHPLLAADRVAMPGDPAEGSKEEAADNDVTALEADEAASPVAEDEEELGRGIYGPPPPKVVKGDLAEIVWGEAPVHFPPALEEAINIVTEKYPSAIAARAALRAAAADLRAAKWLRFPSMTVDVAYLDSSNSPEPQLVVETPIWSGGRIEASIRRAKAAEDVSSYDYLDTILRLAVTTSQTYFEVVRLFERERVLSASLTAHNNLVATMERRVAQEVSPLADLELARSRAAQVEQEFTITRSQRETALRVLAELIADPTYDIGPIPYYDPERDLEATDEFEEQAVTFAPSIRRLQAEADIARADLEARRSSLFPQLNAQYTYDDFFGSRVGVVVRAQTTGGLRQISEVQSARLRIQSALEEIRVADQQLRRDIASDVIEYVAARKRAFISRSATETATRVSESYMRQFIAGRRSWLDVMNALREAISAEIGKSDAEASAMSAAARLELRSGRWRPSFSQQEM